MKKVVLLVMVVIGVILFANNMQHVLIQNVGQSKVEKQTFTEVTRLNVTNLNSNIIIEHEHVYKTMYDESKHWEECIICNEKNSEVVHSFKTTWTGSSSSCANGNEYTNVCECGYKKKGKRPHVWNGSSYDFGSFEHIKLCSKCGYGIGGEYYIKTYGSGTLYKEEGEWKPCYGSNGAQLNCNNFGTCATCKKTYNIKKHKLVLNENGMIYCNKCNENFGMVSYDIKRETNTERAYTVVSNVKLTNGAVFYQTQPAWNTSGLLQTNTQSVSNKNSTGTEFTLTNKFVLKSTVKEPLDRENVLVQLKINGVEGIILNIKCLTMIPDIVEPVIDSISINEKGELNEWSKSKEIIISGTENWTNTVNVEIVDNGGKTIFSGEAVVTNGKYSISCTPELEVGLEGKKFKVIVTDACENKTEKEFTISKIDAIAPEPIFESEVEGDWAKSKRITFKATDKGIGNVSIAFNDIEDLKLANFSGQEYYRDYEFIGDVYSPKELSVLYKDELNNTSIQKIIVDKIDNTAPTITMGMIHNNKLIVNANDIKEGIGEGSGIIKYRYITSSEKLENPEVLIESGIEVNAFDDIVIDSISEVKYVYVVAEDLVGNISEFYEVKVPELVLESKVNLEVKEKGVVELDWSGYDILDKYFVIYRKQDEENEWETLVNLEEKFNESHYMDNLGNDNAVPDVLEIIYNGDGEKNNIQIDIKSQDNGTKYMYYIEAYDVNNMNLLSSYN